MVLVKGNLVEVSTARSGRFRILTLVVKVRKGRPSIGLVKVEKLIEVA